MNPSSFDIGILRDLPNHSLTSFWILSILGLASIIIARFTNASYIAGLFQYTKNYNQQLFSLRSISSPLLTFNYLISLTLAIYIFIESFDKGQLAGETFLVLVFVALYYLLKIGIQYLVANWFARKDIFAIRNALRMYQIAGLVILPLCIFSIYQSNEVKYYSSILFVLVFAVTVLIYLLNSFKDSIQNKISFFYIFLYLCTLEILPLLVLAKFLLA